MKIILVIHKIDVYLLYKTKQTMEKFTEEYAKKLANDANGYNLYCKGTKGIAFDEGYTEGYMKAVEETNAKELLEALIMVKEWAEAYGMAANYYDKVVNAINKVTK